MKLSKFFLKTLKEAPKEAVMTSHILLLRAGYIKKLVSGIYYFTPIGLRVLKKIENIVREEMDKAGANELLMSAVQPKELWVKTRRWDNFGKEMLKFDDRNEREFALGPTHEEVFTNFVKEEVSSYKELPFNIYQIQTKYRDEVRPRFGLLRSREFIMKDAYSFHESNESLDDEYQNMYKTYSNIFTRLGLKFSVVEADSGAMGGNVSHEFQALASEGESEIIYCENCGYSSTKEKAKTKEDEEKKEELLERKEILTKGIKTIAELTTFLNVKENKLIKAVLFKVLNEKDEPQIIATFVRGDREVNVAKVANLLSVNEERIENLSDEDETKLGLKSIGISLGYTGPQNIKKRKDIKIIIDTELTKENNLVAGAGKENYHEENINYKRDYEGDIVSDIKLVGEGDLCFNCGGKLKMDKGIEVGQIFKLGTKYSESLDAKFKTKNETEEFYIMGCYGIGITRTMQAIVEQKNDENGIIFPENVAPFKVIITVVNIKDNEQMNVAEKIYDELMKNNIEVLIDDRDERPGIKFKDADLIGIPYRITVGKKAPEGIVEFKKREEKNNEEIKIDEILKCDFFK